MHRGKDLRALGMSDSEVLCVLQRGSGEKCGRGVTLTKDVTLRGANIFRVVEPER
jgi:hypothetical protein